MKQFVRVLRATVILMTVWITAEAQPTVVTEIPDRSSNLFKAGQFVFFTSGDSLLRTNGTQSGTVFLRNGFTDGFSSLTEFNSMLVFISGDELWRSDGTPGGTTLLITRNELEILAGIGSTLLFSGTDAATGQELYRTNGTSSGTALVSDINPGPGDGFRGHSAVVGENLFFRGNNGVNGDEPWKSNGTAAGTLMIEDINPGPANGFVSGHFDDDFVHRNPYKQGHVYSYNNRFYFSGYTASNGQEPWVSDGTAGGTFMLKDVVAGAEDSAWILYGIGHEGSVYFITKPDIDPTTGYGTASLWKTSGTTASTVLLKSLIEDYSGQEDDGVTYADPFRIYNGKVYFFGRQYLGGHELWVSDGTTSGTHHVYSVNNMEGDFIMYLFEVVDNYLLFYGTFERYPTAVYRSDGTTAGTVQWIHFASGAQDNFPRDLTVVGDLLFYGDHDGPAACCGIGQSEDPDDYFHLFQADPSAMTTRSMRSRYGVSTPGTESIVDYNGKVVFSTRNMHDESTDKQKYLWIYDPNSSSEGEPGTIQQEVWNNVTGTRVSSIPVNTEPSSVTNLANFETPSNAGDNYGSRVRGYVVVPQTGNYTFWISSDDQSQLWLSTDADPANKRKIAEVTGWTTPRQWDRYPSQQSAPISLVSGNKYYIEALHKEGTGGDNLAVGWRLPGGAMERPIPGSRLISFDASANDPVVTITSPNDGATFAGPADLIIRAQAGDENGTIVNVEFYNGTTKLGEDNTSPYSINWNDVAAGSYQVIAKATDNDGATGADTINITITGGMACEGAGMIRQEFWTNVPGTRVSNIPTDTEPNFLQDLTMFEGPGSPVGDNYGSRIRGYICPPASGQYTFWIAGDDQVELCLSTDMDPENKVRIAYHTGWTNSRQWTKYASQQSAPITLSANQRYYIEALMKEGAGADHVSVGWQLPSGALQRPIAGTHLIPFGSADPPTACAGTGTISVETWTGIDGTRVSSIPVNSPPNLTGERNLFEAPTNVGNNFGSRFRGYVCVPTTGNYTFWIASDDHSELWLSTDNDPANKRRIAYHTGWTSPRQWAKYASQQSAPISLVAGQQYYIEALYKEDEGGDNMAVGWQLPDGTLERPIPGNRLSPFEDTGTMTLAENTGEDAARYSQISVYPNPARSGDPELTIAGYEGIEETIETQVEIINLTGEVVFQEKISCGGNCGSYLMDLNKQLVPGVYMVNMQTNGVRTARRLLVE